MLVGPFMLLCAVPALRMIFLAPHEHHLHVTAEPE